MRRKSIEESKKRDVLYITVDVETKKEIRSNISQIGSFKSFYSNISLSSLN